MATKVSVKLRLFYDYDTQGRRVFSHWHAAVWVYDISAKPEVRIGYFTVNTKDSSKLYQKVLQGVEAVKQAYRELEHRLEEVERNLRGILEEEYAEVKVEAWSEQTGTRREDEDDC